MVKFVQGLVRREGPSPRAPIAAMEDLYWDRVHLMTSLERYRELASLLATNVSYAAQLGASCDRQHAQEYATTMMALLSPARVLALIEALIEEEVARTPDDALGSLLRGNNALSKLEAELAKRAGRNWLLSTLGPLLRAASADCAPYEVDPSKVPVVGESASAMLALGAQAVRDLATRVLRAVCSPHSLRSLPPDMCRVAAKTFQAARDRGVEDPLAVAGGFLWLRVLSPALTNPVGAGLVNEGDLHPHTRRLLLLVTKVLQGASNNVLFGRKEPHMVQFNDLITSAAAEIRDFIAAVCNPQRRVSVSSFVLDDDEDADPSRPDELSPTASKGRASPRVVDDYADVAVLQRVATHTLLSLHRLCALFNDKWMASLSTKGLLGKSGTRLVKVSVCACVFFVPPHFSMRRCSRNWVLRLRRFSRKILVTAQRPPRR